MNNLPSSVGFVVLGQSDQVKASPEPVLSHSCSIRFSDADIEFFRSTDPRTIRDPPCRGLGHCGSLSRDPQNSFLARDSVSADRIAYTETRPFDRDIHNSQHEPADHRANSKLSSEVGSDLTGSLGPRETCGISPGSDPGVKYTKGVPCHDNINSSGTDTIDEITCSSEYLFRLHRRVTETGSYNFAKARIPVPSGLNISAWRSFLEGYHDSKLVDFLEFGWPINFDRGQPLISTFVNHPSASSFPAHVQHYIDTELGHGALLGPFSAPAFSTFQCSPLMTAPKKNSAFRRVVMDLSWPAAFSINDGIARHMYIDGPMAMKLPTVDYMEARLLKLGRGAFMYKTDLARGYRQLRVDPLDWGYLSFTHDGAFYSDVCPPFGLRSSAMMMQRTSKAISHIHLQRGFISEPYIDDFGGAELTEPIAGDALFTLQDIFVQLGVAEAKHKVCPPSTTMVWLGILFDSINLTMSIPAPKLQEVVALVRSWRGRTRATRREIQSLFGSLQFVAAVSPPVRVFTNRILEALREAHPTKSTTLSAGFKADLNFFDQVLEDFNGVKIIAKDAIPYQETIEVDACLSGCGGCAGTEFYSAQFPDFVIDDHHPIAHLEMLNLVVAVKLWARDWAGWTVRLFCDNANTCSAVITGRAQDPFMQRCVRELFVLTAAHDIDLKVEHRPGRLMARADALSRQHLGSKHLNFINNDPHLRAAKRRDVDPSLFIITNQL